MRVLVGCCGFPVSRKRYYSMYRVVEVQKTFYKPPSIDTLKKWREEAPRDFEFTVKAWQVMTHRPGSPLWRKAGLRIPSEKLEKYGLLRPTPENFEAWRIMVETARALRADIVVFQTPPSFRCTDENLRNAVEFFSYIRENGLMIGWEPRGDWNNNPDKVREVIESTGIIHVVDILKRRPVMAGDIIYTRLHGLGGEVNYRYRYTDNDLKRLALILDEYKGVASKLYVMFNNIYMVEDASRFRSIASRILEAEIL